MGSDGKKCNLTERVNQPIESGAILLNKCSGLMSKKIECRPMQLKPNVTLSYVTWYNMMLHGVTWCNMVWPNIMFKVVHKSISHISG